MSCYQKSTESLSTITTLITQALALADADGESLLGAKLCDALACAEERLAAVGRHAA